MREYCITTDSTSDLPQDYMEQWRPPVIPLYYSFGSTLYGDEQHLSVTEFYDRMKKGELPVSQPCNPTVIEATFRSIIEQGYDIIHIAFSSALSASYENAARVARELLHEYPDAKITVIDSLNASMGEGLIVMYANYLRATDVEYRQAVTNINYFIGQVNSVFTVDDLFHLQRGGRIGKVAAVVGSALSLKPTLFVSSAGTLCTSNNVMGRKKALQVLVNNVKENHLPHPTFSLPICITHANCLDEAQTLANMIRQELGVPNVLISNVCPTIGSHSGSGTLAVFFYGKPKQSAK